MKNSVTYLTVIMILVMCGCTALSQQKGSPTPPVEGNKPQNNNSESKPRTADEFANILSVPGAEATFKERQELRDLLGWGDSCNFDAQKKTDDEAGRVWGMFAGSKNYVIQVFCDTTGAYSANYLAYLFDTDAKGSELLTFEYFELDKGGKYQRKTTTKPVGMEIDPKGQTITLSDRYYGASQCGWEATYRIVDRKAELIGMRAEWKCDPGTDIDRWPKLDLTSIRKKAKS